MRADVSGIIKITPPKLLLSPLASICYLRLTLRLSLLKENAVLRRLIVGILTIAALAGSDAFAGGYGWAGGNRGPGWHGGRAHIARGRVFYVLPAYPYPLYAYPGSYIPPGYIPENYTYCDPNSGTYIDEDGARRLCR